MGEDPFSAAEKKKKKRVSDNKERHINNLKANRKAALGGQSTVPASVQLGASLPEHGRGKPQKRREMDGAVSVDPFPWMCDHVLVTRSGPAVVHALPKLPLFGRWVRLMPVKVLCGSCLWICLLDFP